MDEGKDAPLRLPTLPRLKFDELPELKFSEIRETLDDLLVAMANLIERRWPSEYSQNLRTVLLGTVKITEITYKSIRYLCADRPEDPVRKLEFAISVPPLSRTILDSVFTVIFLLDNASERLAWYHKSGWRETFEEHQRYQEAYGRDPNWEEYIGWQQAFVEYGRQELGITDAEAANPRREITWWPNPGRMVRNRDTTNSQRDYLRYLNDWFYREMSADSHLSWPGFARRAGHLLNPDEEQRIELLRKYKSDCVMTSITLILCLLSEIEAEFSFGRAQRLKEVWSALTEVFLASREIFEMRYVSRL